MRYAALMFAVLTLAGCRSFEDDASFGYSRTGLTVRSAFTTADVRIITQRTNPVTGQEVVCTEPSPDVSKAISTAFALSGQGSYTPPTGTTGTGPVTGSAATSMGSAEAIAELAGRSTALLGLRDGLFQACQAYANGAIGADAYALIVSRYGQLLTTLFLGQDIAGIPQPMAAAASPPVSVTANAGGTGPNSSVTMTGTPPSPQAGTAPAPQTGAANALTRMNEDYLNLDYNFIHTLAVACINQGDPTIMVPPDQNRDNKYRQTNPWLTAVCDQMKGSLTPAALAQLGNLATGLVKGQVLAPPVNPANTTTTTATLTQPAPKQPAPKK
jgi:hypothetical protein